MDRLDALAALVAIAEHGGFAAAARAMRVSPQAVTRAIAGLEARLGVPLFQRTTRSVRLTEEGAAFLERARGVLADLRDAELAAAGSAAEPQGTLKVTAPVVFGRLHVVPLLARLLAVHPRLRAELVLVDRVVHLVEEGIDAAVRVGTLADSALRAIKLGEVRRVLVASPAYLEANGTPETVDDLRRHGVVAFTGVSPTDEWRFGPDGRTAATVRPRLVVNTAAAAIAAALEGVGVARVLSYQVGAEVASGRLVELLAGHAPSALPVNLLFQAARAASPPLRVLLGAAKAHFRDRDL